MRIRFWIALWAGKLAMAVLKLLGKEEDDRPGILIYRLCPDFLKYVRKPKYTVAVTGTNGKSTVTALINDLFRAMGMKTSFNTWGANLKAGHCYLMAKSVNILNRPLVDASGWYHTGDGDVVDIAVSAWTLHQTQYTLYLNDSQIVESEAGAHFKAAYRPRQAGEYKLYVTVTDDKGFLFLCADTAGELFGNIGLKMMYLKKDIILRMKKIRSQNLT